MDFLKDIAKTAGNEYAALVSEGVEAGESFVVVQMTICGSGVCLWGLSAACVCGVCLRVVSVEYVCGV